MQISLSIILNFTCMKKYFNKKVIAIAVLATPIAMFGALWLNMLHSVKGIDITKGWGESAE